MSEYLRLLDLADRFRAMGKIGVAKYWFRKAEEIKGADTDA